MRSNARTVIVTLFLAASAGTLSAQSSASDQAARLREVLPADVAERVLARIAEARTRELPAAALEQRALKFAAKGVDPAAIERSVSEHADRMLNARNALNGVRTRRAADDELEAGAEALRKGVSGAQLGALAKSAPSGRSLAVPLYALTSLIDRGLPADQALQRVQERLNARAGDEEFQRIATDLPSQSAAGQAHKPDVTGTDLANTKRGANTPGGRAVGRPATIPGNAGQTTRPTPKKPTTPPGRGSGRGEQLP